MSSVASSFHTNLLFRLMDIVPTLLVDFVSPKPYTFFLTYNVCYKQSSTATLSKDLEPLNNFLDCLYLTLHDSMSYGYAVVSTFVSVISSIRIWAT